MRMDTKNGQVKFHSNTKHSKDQFISFVHREIDQTTHVYCEQGTCDPRWNLFWTCNRTGNSTKRLSSLLRVERSIVVKKKFNNKQRQRLKRNTKLYSIREDRKRHLMFLCCGWSHSHLRPPSTGRLRLPPENTVSSERVDRHSRSKSPLLCIYI